MSPVKARLIVATQHMHRDAPELAKRKIVLLTDLSSAANTCCLRSGPTDQRLNRSSVGVWTSMAPTLRRKVGSV
jgi:hypothetical protein